jgi:L-arabinose transport system permease protein
MAMEHERGIMKERAWAIVEQAGMLVVLAGLVIYCAATVDKFASLPNVGAVLLAVSTVGIVSCTMLFCLASGNFDLSVGTVVPCAGVVAALVMGRLEEWGWLSRMAAGIGAGLGFGAAVGFINGFVVAKCKINPLITTLATMQMVRGFGLVISKSNSVTAYDPHFTALGLSAFPVIHGREGQLLFQMTVPVWACLVCFLFFGLLLQWTVFGRDTLAIGGNEEAARLAGVAVDRVKIIIFTMQGVVAAMAGIFLLARSQAIRQDSSQGLELQVIAACVLGGVSLTGGVGRMSFVVAGVFIMGVVENAMALKQVDPSYRYLVSGGILLAAVLFDRLKQRRGS